MTRSTSTPASDDPEWQHVFVWLEKPTPDGPLRGWCMRRKSANGTVEYRRMTLEEEAAEARNSAW